MSESVLLINPNSLKSYANSFMRFFAPKYPPLNLLTLAGNVDKKVVILDFSVLRHPYLTLKKVLEINNFKYIGITSTTPNMDDTKKIIEIIRDHSPSSLIILGGSHITALPEDSLNELRGDIVCIGEGEITFREIVSGKRISRIRGIGFFQNNNFILTKKRPLIQNLDSLLNPKWDLVDPKKYYMIFSKKNPTGLMETSRGCPFGCTYCHKKTFGKTFRFKSSKKVVDEMEFMLNKGFKEIHIADDCFALDKKRAISICDEIIERKMDFPWALFNGIRVDTVSKELFKKLHYSGCHIVSFGIESGSQKILDSVRKGTNLKQIKKAFKLARDSGIETLINFFMIGLPDEEMSDFKKTLDLAKTLDADITKVTIAIPYPGTLLLENYISKGMMTNKSWSSYRMHKPEQLYIHPNLNWEEITYCYNKIMLVNRSPRHCLSKGKKILKVYTPRFFKNFIYIITNN